MNNEKTLKILGLSTKEEKVLVALSEGLDTPLLVSRSTKVTRAAVYEVLKKLKNYVLCSRRKLLKA
jgi:sugar-specific transcriptional regulator TrmB